jgi:fructokinase
MKILSIGETIWDVIDLDEHLGGAPFNFSVHATRLGHDVTFLSGVGADRRGERALEQARLLGIDTGYIQTTSDAPTGTATVELDAARQPHFEIHRPAAYDHISLTETDLAAITSQSPTWIYFGTLHQVNTQAHDLTKRVLDANPQAGRFYDINLRPNCYTSKLVRDLARRANAVKLNESEAETLALWCGLPAESTERFCRDAAALFGWRAVCVTRGANGCAMLIGDDYHESPGLAVRVVDAVGAGDAFSAAFLHGLGEGWGATQAADFANRVGALVASRPGATLMWAPDEIEPGA